MSSQSRFTLCLLLLLCLRSTQESSIKDPFPGLGHSSSVSEHPGFRIHLLSPTFLMLYFWSQTWTSLSTLLPLINKLVGWSAWFSFEILPQEPDTCWKMSLKRHDCQLTHVVLLASPAPRVHQEHCLEKVMCGVENTYMIYVAKLRASS